MSGVPLELEFRKSQSHSVVVLEAWWIKACSSDLPILFSDGKCRFSIHTGWDVVLLSSKIVYVWTVVPR